MSFIEGASLRLARTAGALAYLAFIALAFEPAQAQQTPTLSLIVALPEDAITDFALNQQTNKLYLTDVSGKVSVVDPAAKTNIHHLGTGLTRRAGPSCDQPRAKQSLRRVQ